jgi:hypothetical protein
MNGFSNGRINKGVERGIGEDVKTPSSRKGSLGIIRSVPPHRFAESTRKNIVRSVGNERNCAGEDPKIRRPASRYKCIFFSTEPSIKLARFSETENIASDEQMIKNTRHGMIRLG